MKKRIYLFVTILMSLFIFSNRVEAVSMYLKCTYTQECANGGTKEWYENSSLNRWCHPEYQNLLLLTTKTGKLVPYALNDDYKTYTLDQDYNSYGCWLTEMTDNNCSNAQTYDYGPASIFTSKTCPSGLLNNKGAGGVISDSVAAALVLPPPFNKIASYYLDSVTYSDLIPYGQNGTEIDSSDINNSEYIIYSFIKDNKKYIIAEAYSPEGHYSYIGPNMKEKAGAESLDEVISYSIDKYKKFGGDYWKIHENFDTRIIAAEENTVKLDGMNVCQGLSEEKCKNEYSYEVIIGTSAEGNDKMNTVIETWYNEIMSNGDKLKELADVVNRANFLTTSKAFNETMAEGKKYKFQDFYTKDDFINDLKDAYVAIEKVYSSENIIIDYATGAKTKASSSILSKIYMQDITVDVEGNQGVKSLQDLYNNDKEHRVNEGFLINAIEDHIDRALETFVKTNDADIDIINVSENIREYMEMFYTSVAFLNSNPFMYSLDGTQGSDIKQLKENFKNFIDENNLLYNPIVDCESLLGEELVEKINDYLDIIKIAVPILLIGFGIIEFTKAIFASDEDKMKKAKEAFLKRLFISILIFISPMIVNLLLNIANRVWTFISPNSCGLF